jgi:hypothetical protein
MMQVRAAPELAADALGSPARGAGEVRLELEDLKRKPELTKLCDVVFPVGALNSLRLNDPSGVLTTQCDQRCGAASDQAIKRAGASDGLGA